MSVDEMSGVLIDQNRNNVSEIWTATTTNSETVCEAQCDRVHRPVKHAVRRRQHTIKPLNGICLPQNPQLSDDSTFTRLKSRDGKSEDKGTPSREDENHDGSSSRDEEDASCELNGEDRQEDDIEDFIKWRVCLVKLYAWIKEEMSKSTARSIAHHLYQSEPRLLSRFEHESIVQSAWRREAVEQLLKKILMGPCSIYQALLDALLVQEEKHIADRLREEQPSEEDIEVFTKLEQSSLQQCLRPDHDEPRLHFTDSDQQTLLYFLNNKNSIDHLNDHLLSRFIFSIREHTNIVHSSLDCECRVRLLLNTLMLCAEKTFRDFCEIMVTIEMAHVIQKLEKRSQTPTCKQRHKRKAQLAQGHEVEPTTSHGTSSAKKPCFNSEVECRLVSSMQKSSSTIRLQAMDQLGFDVETINKGSIVIQLCPKEPDSWHRLEENCRTGKIKDFIPVVYNNESVKDLLQDGEYRLKFTIYTLPTNPALPGEKKAMFHLETEEQTASETKESTAAFGHHDNQIEEQLDLLCEELEITKDLLNILKKEKLVDQNIKEEIDKQGPRAKRIKYLLKKLATHGDKGYTVLKEYIKDENEDLYKAMVTREGVKVIDSKMDTAAKVTKTKPASGGHRGVFKKEVFFTGTVVLKVKRKVLGKKGKEECKSTLDISCPEIINPVCYFAAKDKENQTTSGEVTMVLEDAWCLGKEASPQRDLLVGKRKQKKESESHKKRHHDGASCEEEGEEEGEVEVKLTHTDLSSDNQQAETSAKTDVKKEKENSQNDDKKRKDKKS